MAFDKQTGQLAWKAVPGERPAMSSPIAVDLAGVRHILTFTEKQFVGLDANTGELLWSYPFETAYRQNIVTPVVVGDVVVASGVQKFAFALRVSRMDNGLAARELWKNRDLRMYMSSPVVVQDHLYGLGAGNALVCVHVASGKTRWAEGNFGEYCSTVVAGDRLLLLSADGELSVVQADPARYQELSRTRVSQSATWSHLALVGSRIFVRDRRELACLE
jgi:outer membrane protein assembly factor BamB